MTTIARHLHLTSGRLIAVVAALFLLAAVILAATGFSDLHTVTAWLQHEPHIVRDVLGASRLGV
jgi:hypothetical protein